MLWGLTITPATAIVRHLALVKLLVVAGGSRWVAYGRALEIDAKLAFAAEFIRQVYELEHILLQFVSILALQRGVAGLT
jgi:hypothetical protein